MDENSYNAYEGSYYCVGMFFSCAIAGAFFGAILGVYDAFNGLLFWSSGKFWLEAMVALSVITTTYVRLKKNDIKIKTGELITSTLLGYVLGFIVIGAIVYTFVHLIVQIIEKIAAVK
jgi:hypothetical protein